jgi:uncharacterized protein (TIGR03435 family)
MRYSQIAAMAALLCATIIGAAQNQPLKFEVASVKASQAANTSNYTGCDGASTLDLFPKGRCIARNATLRTIIGDAYRINVFLNDLGNFIIGGPSWIASDRFDIEGKAENDSATTDELYAMLRNLLADRFKLQAREEMREESGYALIVGKNGAKLRPTTGDKQRGIAAHGSAPTELEGTNSSMTDLVRYLSLHLHHPFTDETGLSGRYDFKITFVYDAPPLPNVQLPAGARLAVLLNDSALPAVSGALDQVGLRLQAKHVPVRMIVIDHADRPDAN